MKTKVGRDFEPVSSSRQQTDSMGRFRRLKSLSLAQYHSRKPPKRASQRDLEETPGMDSQAVKEQEEPLTGW